MKFNNLHEILRSLYNEMMPLSADMAAVAKGVAGLGALFYVAIKVWQALSRAEPIDMYPLLRPFALGLCIMFFPTIVLGTVNAILSPVVQGTHAILENQVLDLNKLQQQKDKLEREAMLRNPETAYLASNEEFDKKLEELGWSPSDLATMSGMYLDRQAYKMEKAIKDWFRNLLEVLSVWEGFQSTLTQWFTRYISVYLWLPVADLFSSMLAKIQSLILERDIAMLTDPTFIPDTSNTVYIIFMIIGIVGYFTIPTVTGWIIQAGGGGNYTRNVNQTAMKAGNIAGAGAGSSVGNIGGKLMNK